jgi:hypothetical protein
MAGTSWNTNAEFFAELEINETGAVEDLTHEITSDQAPILGHLAPYLEQQHEPWALLIINFQSQGYDDPGSTYDPSTAYPPEHSDERTPNEAYLQAYDKTKTPLPPELTEALFDHYITQIEETELPEPDPGPEGGWDENILKLGNTITEDPDINAEPDDKKCPSCGWVDNPDNGNCYNCGKPLP